MSGWDRYCGINERLMEYKWYLFSRLLESNSGCYIVDNDLNFLLHSRTVLKKNIYVYVYINIYSKYFESLLLTLSY